MRPIRLEVEGFTCYRERQTPLDFTGLSLFAIAGPTGAGKSSILDAMLYALYGEIPRLGAQGRTDIISHGRDTVSVLFDFALQDRHYRVTRRVKRRAKSAPQSVATLAEITRGTERSIADGVRGVNDTLEALLGLPYEDFTQTVILPQGEFARFLQAEPRGQREILQRLLRHEVFERMRQAADERRRQLDLERQRIEGQLERCAGATEEALTALESELSAARALQAERTTGRTKAEAAFEAVRRGREATIALEQCRRQWAVLEAQACGIDAARQELADARRAATIVPRLEASRDAAIRLTTTQQAEARARDAAAQADEQRRAADTRLEAVAAEARLCDSLTQQIRRLDEIAGDLTRRAELTTALDRLPKELLAAERAVRTANTREEATREALAVLATQLQALAGELADTPVDSDLLLRLEALREDGARARGLVRELTAAEEEFSRCESARVDTERRLAELARAELAARESALAATAARDRAREARESAIDRHRAAALRAHLHVGDACPVCRHIVAELPPVETPPEVATLDEALRKAEKRAENAATTLSKAGAALATGRARFADARDAVERASARREATAQTVAEALARIQAALALAGDAIAGVALLDWIDGRRAELAAAKAAHDRVRDRQRELERARADAAIAHATATADLRQAGDRLQALRDEQARLQAELAAVIERIETVTTAPDPRAERDRLEREVSRLRDAERLARDAVARAEQVAAAAGERLRAAERSAGEAASDHARVQEALTTALAACGFGTAADAERAVRSADEQESLQRRVVAHDEARAAVLQRMRDLEPQLAGGEVTEEVLREAERQRDRAVDAWRDADQALVRLESECVRLRSLVAERQQLLEARAAHARVFDTTAELAMDLRSDRFQEYLLEEAFQQLVAGASVRMKAISGRYTLEWEPGGFYVVDHENAGERRRAETLSGGETFMASLCLALQLSDEVLRASGALRMDSLFIDEGFGTLDDEALRDVTNAIYALQHDGNRIIGVISHRAELTDNLPGCIRVQKGLGESAWEMERVG